MTNDSLQKSTVRAFCLAGWAQKHDFFVNSLAKAFLLRLESASSKQSCANQSNEHFFPNFLNNSIIQSGPLDERHLIFGFDPQNQDVNRCSYSSLYSRKVSIPKIHFQNQSDHLFCCPEHRLKHCKETSESIILNLKSFDYLSHDSFDSVKSELQNLCDIDLVIAWSLGGQLAMRLISAGILKTKFLILIATPFQFLKEEQSSILEQEHREEEGFKASSKEEFLSIRNQIAINAELALRRFAVIASLGGSIDEKSGQKFSQIDDFSKKNLKKLLYWLDQLAGFSARDMRNYDWPQSLIIQGKNDRIVDMSQSKILGNLIKSARIEFFENCGHAPHLNDLDRFSKIICDVLYKNFSN